MGGRKGGNAERVVSSDNTAGLRVVDRAEERGAMATFPVPSPMRGSVVRYLSFVAPGTPSLEQLAVVVSNNVQNEELEYLIVVPLERRRSRLSAPYGVDLGRSEGFRELHVARCDLVTTINRSALVAIERAGLSDNIILQFEQALRVALGFRDSI